MKPDMMEQAAEYAVKRQRRRRRRKLLTCLGAAVVFCTTYALILPAVTMESPYLCGTEEHLHSTECYETVEREQFRAELVCTPEVHTHTPECFDPEGHLICGLADRLIHRHDADCYYNDELICPLPEIAEHIHSEACFEQTRELICQLDETRHEHGGDCFEYQPGELICGMDETEEHTHTDVCREQIQTLICILPEDPEGHEHGEDCYTVTSTLTCPLEQIAVHTHTEECYSEDGTLTCTILSAAEHQHTGECLAVTSAGMTEEKILLCGWEEHIHDETCLPEKEESTPGEDDPYICGLPEHLHETDCFDAAGELICGLEEHLHGDACAAPEISAEVENVIEQIDALPSVDEIAAILAAYEESDYWEGYEKYFSETAVQAQTVYCYYEELTPEQKAQVTNADRLWDLEWLWSADTLDLKDTVTVYQVNSYSQAKATLVYGGSVGNKLGGSMSYAYWHAIIVEKSNGQLYVSQVITATTSKRNCAATTAGGFVLLVHETSVNASVGDYVEVSFDYTKTAAYTSAGHGTVTFTTDAPSAPKADKDNSTKLDTVDGADTRDYIEVNLYDYGSNINTNWNSSKTYPGFQQGGGEKSGSATVNSNFGDNITSDLDVGLINVTSQGGAINTIVSGANRPAVNAMQGTLGTDGYPALANGASLKYLFTNNTYAEKLNTQSINGLFRYDPQTSFYSFNSRENHAQYDPSDNTFTLYQQIITPNFTMYPFGNFMPFNDIVHDSAQVSTMDREYLLSIADSARYKYSQGAGDAYSTLATALTNWINAMDEEYEDGWNIADGATEYFANTAAIPDVNFNSATAENTALQNNTYNIDYDEETDFFFGMEIKMNFMQPKGGHVGQHGTDNMIFYFTGDDDVWVYIDGVLFLDLSGIHRHVGGEIDFVNGEVRYYSLDPSTGDVSNTAYQTLTFQEILENAGKSASVLNEHGTFQNYSHHAFNFYYMERGAGSGVCRMKFNFPLLRENSISVTKELSSDYGEALPLLGNPDFRFQALKVGDNSLFIGANTAYEIYDPSGNKIGSGTTDENGIFSIKANQTAVFSEIAENEGQYFVRELLDPSIFEQYGQITVDGSSTTTDYNITIGTDSFTGVESPVKNIADGSTVFKFNNHVSVDKMGGLSITKTLTPDTGQQDLTFDLLVSLDDLLLPEGITYQVGSATRTVQTRGIITLAPGETAVISNVLAGSAFTVKETDDSAHGYQVSYTVDNAPQQGQATGTVGLRTTVNVVVNNAVEGTSVTIPVQKFLQAPDGQEHTYSFTLTQVTGQDGLTEVESGFTRELSIPITREPVTDQFVIGYPQAALSTLPQTFWYRITEYDDPADTSTVFDTAVYIVKVTVSAADSGALSAELSGIWKDGEDVSQTGQVVFTNQIIRYELPQTGGGGTRSLYVAGLLLTAAAGLVLLYRRKRGKGEPDFP